MESIGVDVARSGKYYNCSYHFFIGTDTFDFRKLKCCSCMDEVMNGSKYMFVVLEGIQFL